MTDAPSAAATGADDDPARSGPLAGLLVMDFTRVLAGPLAAMLLADLGARVIKIEPPVRGDDSRHYGPFAPDGRSYYFARVNRGKQSIALDLKRDADVARAIAARADVLVENYRPGVMDRLGLGYDDLAKVNPRLVYASLSGFGQNGPLADAPAYDAVVQAMSGLMAVTGAPDGPPVKSGSSIADLTAGVYCFGGIMAALAGRARTGRGSHVDIAMFDATVSLLEGYSLGYLAHGAAPERAGNHHLNIAPFGSFATADAEIVICCGNDQLFRSLCGVIGRPDLPRDPRFADNTSRARHKWELGAVLESALAARPAAEWLVLLASAGIPCGPVNDVAAAIDHPQTTARRMVITAGGLRLPGEVIKLSGYPDPEERPAAPELDEHGAAIRAEFGGPDPST